MATLTTAIEGMSVSGKEIDPITTKMSWDIMKLQLKDSIAVEEIARKNVPRVQKICPMKDAVGTMEQRGVQCLLVEEGGKVSGFLTKRDAEMALAWNAHYATVSEFAAPINAVSGKTTLIKVARIMGRTGARHVVVMDERDAIVGVVSLDDILVVAPELIRAFYSLDDLLRFSLESGFDISVHMQNKVKDLTGMLGRNDIDSKEAMRELMTVFKKRTP